MVSLVYGRTSHCIVFVCGSDALAQREWDDYVAFLRESLIGGAPPRALAVTWGGGPNSAQRQQLNEAVAPWSSQIRSAVLTPSKVTMGIVTAMSWFVPGIRAFSPERFDAALGFLEVPAVGVGAVRLLVNEFKLRLGLAPLPDETRLRAGADKRS